LRAYRPEQRRPAEPVGPLAVVPQKLHGLRSWLICTDASGEFRLRGHIENALWRDGGETTWAECRHGGRRGHASPAPIGGCTCGLYAAHPWSPGAALNYAPRFGTPLAALGLVEAWGTVHLYRDGFRAQYAKPSALVLRGAMRRGDYARLVETLAESHYAEVIQVADTRELVRLCRGRGLGFTPAVVDELVASSQG
jgi:hypothetical protein